MIAPLAIEVPSASHLLHRALQSSGPTTIIICSSQDSFLSALSTELNRDATAAAPLLSNTLNSIAKSSNITLVFTPELAHLRAYLSTLTCPQPASPTPRHRTPILLILSLLPLLHNTPGTFTAQTLMRTCALAIDAAHAQESRLILAECRTPASDDEQHEEGIADSDADDEGQELTLAPDSWTQSVPMLAAAGSRLGEDAVDLAARTVQVRRVVGRWCRFGDLEDIWAEEG